LGFRAGLSPQWQTLIDGMIVVLALSGPGLVRFFAGLRSRGRA
jgi:hypothetical protein